MLEATRVSSCEAAFEPSFDLEMARGKQWTVRPFLSHRTSLKFWLVLCLLHVW